MKTPNIIKDTISFIKAHIDTPYEQDAKFIKKWTGAIISEDQFYNYQHQGTLRKSFGSDKKIRKKFYIYGMAEELSAMSITNAVLDQLAYNDITFNIDQNGMNDNLHERLCLNARACIVRGHSPNIPHAYAQSPRLSASLDNIRAEYDIPILDDDIE